jgi:hypothetical protein
MICSIWITLTAAIKPNKRPNNDNSHEFRYLNAIKYPLIEQKRMSRERISKKHPSFLNYFPVQILKFPAPGAGNSETQGRFILL